MERIYSIILVLHIIAGTLALSSGAIAFSVRKGKGWHTKAGSLYFYAMLAVGLTAFGLCLLKYNPFLLVIGLFSLYMTLTGYRSMQLPANPANASLRFDWTTWSITVAGLLSFLLLNLQKEPTALTPVLFTFSAILTAMLLLDLKTFRQKKWDRNILLKRHISRMGGAYIATFTAFLVNNLHTDPAFIAWLLPTVAGTPLIMYFQYRFSPKRKKLTKTA